MRPDTDTFTQADDVVKFARNNGKTLHAHALIWHADYQVPARARGGVTADLADKACTNT
ncbi:endo-1,4-beta-xylanase [Massilia aquatica]|uniref:endo-1,4-beta-xylanase n=1 Tax=Massilia aquatica TaxID=2609000 RepID=UPI00351CF5F0